MFRVFFGSGDEDTSIPRIPPLPSDSPSDHFGEVPNEDMVNSPETAARHGRQVAATTATASSSSTSGAGYYTATGAEGPPRAGTTSTGSSAYWLSEMPGVMDPDEDTGSDVEEQTPGGGWGHYTSVPHSSSENYVSADGMENLEEEVRALEESLTFTNNEIEAQKSLLAAMKAAHATRVQKLVQEGRKRRKKNQKHVSILDDDDLFAPQSFSLPQATVATKPPETTQKVQNHRRARDTLKALRNDCHELHDAISSYGGNPNLSAELRDDLQHHFKALIERYEAAVDDLRKGKPRAR